MGGFYKRVILTIRITQVRTSGTHYNIQHWITIHPLPEMKVPNFLRALKQTLPIMRSADFINLENQYGCHNYHPLPVVVDRAEGIHVWDVEGKKYMDFLSGYSAVNQGHLHPKILNTFLEQSMKVTLTSRAVHNNMLGLAEQKLHQVFGYDKALLMNTGVEAGESAIKFARRWGYRVKKIPANSATVLFATGNFWGRTLAACASSDDPDRYMDFGPFGGLNFELVEYGNLEALEAKLKENPNIVAFMVQPIQGERGVVVPPKGYLSGAHQLLRKHNALLICDEVQTGLGRTGKMLCSEYQNIRPDMVLLGKALSGGFMPVSAVLCDNEIMNLIKPGEHGSTYGGNPLASALLMTSLDVIIDEKMCQNASKQGKQLMTNIRSIFKGNKVKEVRGKGLFIGIEFEKDKNDPKFTWNLALKFLQNGIITKPTHDTIMRLSPPIIINEQQVSQASELIEKSWKEYLKG